ncbi:MAG: DUF308 domain-containing protein [Butyrivibrio sp.]|nr:DUF308 domain-containing protein [Butyrivibrio sp.]
MTRLQKIKSFLSGFTMLIFAIILMLVPQDSYPIIILVISLGLIFYGLKILIYYFTMARYMVGGKNTLIKGVIILDFGFLAGSLTDVPAIYILMYLIIIHAFSGLVDILRVYESHKYGARSWKLQLIHGIVNIALAVICIIFIRNANTAVYIYCLGLIYSAIIRMITAFRKTTLIFIQ